MARCHSCNTYLGLGIFSRWVNMDGHAFCQPCSEQWHQERHQRTLTEMCAGQLPNELFTIQRVWARNPDRPRSRERLLGQLAFTDKGVCFIQVASDLAADAGWGLAFGAIGAIIAESGAKRRRAAAFDSGEEHIVRQATDFVDLLHRAERVLFYPREDITKLRINASGVIIHLSKSKHRYGILGGRKVYRPLQEIAEAYRTAIETHSDLVLACKYIEHPDHDTA